MLNLDPSCTYETNIATQMSNLDASNNNLMCSVNRHEEMDVTHPSSTAWREALAATGSGSSLSRPMPDSHARPSSRTCAWPPPPAGLPCLAVFPHQRFTGSPSPPTSHYARPAPSFSLAAAAAGTARIRVCLIFFTARSFVDLGGARGAIFFTARAWCWCLRCFFTAGSSFSPGVFFSNRRKTD